jgi:hypothetical protein
LGLVNLCGFYWVAGSYLFQVLSGHFDVAVGLLNGFSGLDLSFFGVV